MRGTFLIKKFIALLLVCVCLQGSALAGGVEMHLALKGSDILSGGAQQALTQWLQDAHLTVLASESAQEAALYYDGAALLTAVRAADGAALTAGDLTAPLVTGGFSLSEAFAQASACAAQLGTLLSDYEKSANATAELGGVVKAKTQLSYALSSEQWAEVWPAVCGILGEGLAQCAIESKGTLRRYFAADGSEIGAYFYAEKVRIAQDDVREVRLEYGFQPEAGLYLAFRCPNARETRNLRISLSAKRAQRTDRINYTVSGDIRSKRENDQDTLTIESSLKEMDGILSGKATVNYTQKRGDTSVKYALIVKPEVNVTTAEGVIAFDYDRAGLQVIAGEIALTKAAEKDIKLPLVNAQEAQVIEALAQKLILSLDKISPEDRLELLYYLNRPAFLTGDEKQIYLQGDPEFMVTEVPE